MIRVSAIVLAAVILAAPGGLSIPAITPEPAQADERADATRELRIGLDLSVNPDRVSLDGFLVYHSEPLVDDSRAADGRIHTVELLATPTAADSMHLLVAMSRVMRTVVRSAARQWWHGYHNSLNGEND